MVKTPWWLKKLYPARLWHVDTEKKILYLTFDDGPHPEATAFVLNELKKHDALATFFCIGKNVLEWPDVYKRILDEGHAVGNHTQNHLNGWRVSDDVYMKDIAQAANYIDSGLFRPPYGRITSFQAKHLRSAMRGRKPKIIMWDVLSADFDTLITAEKCLENVIFKSRPGSIIVFHDSEKAFSKLQYCLPRILNFFSEKDYRFDTLKGMDEEGEPV
ncbi:MAG: polysaccharide deacetylase family protein [Chitinophagaceae bacterium]|nr:polysaccharide deacetylase family protein [Chitinophagaceae bacterium]